MRPLEARGDVSPCAGVEETVGSSCGDSEIVVCSSWYPAAPGWEERLVADVGTIYVSPRRAKDWKGYIHATELRTEGLQGLPVSGKWAEKSRCLLYLSRGVVVRRPGTRGESDGFGKFDSLCP